MKYTVHYKVNRTVVIDCIGKPSHEDLHARAVWAAKNDAGNKDIEVVQILAEGVPSGMGRDNPEPPRPPTLPKPPAPPGTPHSGDLKLQRNAA
jgi:hypothetical protein